MVPRCYMLCLCVYGLQQYGELNISLPTMLFCNLRQKLGKTDVAVVFN